MSWRERILGESVELLTDGSHNPPPAKEAGIPMLSARNVSTSGIDLDPGYRLVSEEDYLEEAKRAEPQSGDVLLTIVGTIGRTTVVRKQSLPFVLQRSVALLRPTRDLLPEYLGYWLESPKIQHFLLSNARGTAQKGVYLKTLRSVPISYSSLDAQKEICAKLDLQLSRHASCVWQLKQIQAKLKQARASILKAAVEGRLVERAMINNQRFPVLSVGEICSMKPANGRSVPTLDGGFPVLRLTAMKGGKIDFAEMKGGAWSEEEAAKWIIEEGDFFVMRGNGSIKRVGDGAIAKQVPCKVAYPDTMIRIRADPERLDSRYLLHLWRSPLLRSQIESAAKTTAGIFKINQRDIASFRLPIPTLGEQREIVAEVDRRISVLDQVEAAATTSLSRCSKLRQAILRKAFIYTR